MDVPIIAGAVAAARRAARAAVARIGREVHAHAVALDRAEERAGARSVATRLIRTTRVAARTAVVGVVLRNGHAVADAAVVGLAVAVVVDAVAADLLAAGRCATAHARDGGASSLFAA